MAGVGVLRVFVQRLQQHIGIEDVDPHGGADHGGIEARALGVAVLRLLLEAHDAVVLVDLGHAEARGFLRRHLDGGDGDVGLVRAVPVQHLAVVHLVDVVAGEDQGLLGRFRFDALEILEDRVGRALVPVLVHALHGREHFDVFAQFGREDVPAVAHVADQVQRFVLC